MSDVSSRIDGYIQSIDAGHFMLPDELLSIAGLSSRKIRQLLNYLCSEPGVRYLEIGIHTGSTLVPALYGNAAQAVAIDNWQGLEGDKRSELRANLDRFIPDWLSRLTLIESDCWTVDPESTGDKLNVYFYDGDHSRPSQYQAIVHFAPALAAEFVILVDDFRWAEPSEETYRALDDLHYDIMKSWILPALADRTGEWWDGLGIFWVKKE